MKKISLIVTSLVFCIAAVFIFPAKEASANPLAVGGALYLGGAGVYVVGAVAVAGIVGLTGCSSCQEDIEAHAARTWEGSTQVVKDGMQSMIDASIGVGNALTATDSRFNSWMSGQIDALAVGIADSQGYSPAGVFFDTGSGGTQFRLNFNPAANTIMYGGVAIAGSVNRIPYMVSSTGYLTYNTGTGTNTSTVSGDVTKMKDMLFSITTLSGLMAMHNTYFTSSQMTLGYANVNYQEAHATAKANMTEAWEEMTDAGLVLPTDNARPMNGDIPLTYNPVTDTYTGIDGVNVPRENITIDYPTPNWKSLNDLANLGLSGLGAGLYIDGWAGSDSVTSTYNPTTDVTTTVTSGTTTGVTTGVTSTTSVTTTTTGDTTGNPPVDPPPTTAPKTGEPLNPFKAKPMPIAALTGLFQLLAALIFYLIRMFTFIATLALIAPTPIDNPYFLWFTTATFQGITPFPLVRNLALFFLGFSVYRSVRRVFG